MKKRSSKEEQKTGSVKKRNKVLVISLLFNVKVLVFLMLNVFRFNVFLKSNTFNDMFNAFLMLIENKMFVIGRAQTRGNPPRKVMCIVFVTVYKSWKGRMR